MFINSHTFIAKNINNQKNNTLSPQTNTSNIQLEFEKLAKRDYNSIFGRNKEANINLPAGNNNFADKHLSISPRAHVADLRKVHSSLRKYQIGNHAMQGIKANSEVKDSDFIALPVSVLSKGSKLNIAINSAQKGKQLINAIDSYPITHSKSSNGNKFIYNSKNNSLEINLHKSKHHSDELRFQESEIENLAIDIIIDNNSIGQDNIAKLKEWVLSSNSGEQLVIGRDSSSDILVSSNKASRTHITFTKNPDNSITLSDSSTNGSKLLIKKDLDISKLLGKLKDGQEITIGRDSSCDLNLDPEAKDISRVHLTIMKKDNYLYIYDGSFDGTNAKASKLGSQVDFVCSDLHNTPYLNAGDSIRIPGILENTNEVVNLNLPKLPKGIDAGKAILVINPGEQFNIEPKKSKQNINLITTPKPRAKIKPQPHYKYLDPVTTLEKLYPKGLINFKMKQDNLGVCYMLAAIESIKNSPEKLNILKHKVRMHEKQAGEEQQYSADFYDEDGVMHTVTIKESDLNDESGKALVKDETSLGIKVLARLYTRFLKQDELRRGLPVIQKSIVNAEGRDANGDPRKVYTHLFGNKQHRVDREKIGDEKFMAELKSFFKKHAANNYKNDTAAYLSINMQGLVNPLAHGGHAFALDHVSNSKGNPIINFFRQEAPSKIIVSLINPWDNSSTIDYSLEKLMKSIEAITYMD
ncbi:MAG: FHA domain-containing protein [Candidatus Caenarcaniphilales bacterium]|nr:FHA domain-containing protein [Candidatus Caenarcaniphilales bacterium]